jgi:adenine phosphoribosyltransferase
MNAPVIQHGEFYDIYPSFGSLYIEPDLIKAVCSKLVEIGNFDCDKIALIESMAIPVGTALALDLKLPYTVIRKRQYKLPDEVSISEHTGYDRADFYINGITAGQKIVLFDDTLNTGETLKAVVTTLREIGAEVVDVITIMDKSKFRKELEEELGLPIKTIVEVKIDSDGVKLNFEVD